MARMRTEEVVRWILLQFIPLWGAKRGICSRAAGLSRVSFRPSGSDEIIQSLNDGGISNIGSRDLLFGNGPVIANRP